MPDTSKPNKKNRHAVVVQAALADFGKASTDHETPEPGPAFSTTSRPMAEVRQILLAEITPDQSQPRRVQIDSEGMADLIQSVREQGVFNPIILRRADDGYVIIAGERRWTAARAVGLQHIPARVMDVSREEARLIQLAENLQREDLNPIEEAEGLHRLMQETGWSTRELGLRLGKSKSYVSRMVSINTRFSPEIQEELRTVAHAQRPSKTMIFEALAAPTEAIQRRILFGDLTRDQARRAKGQSTSKAPRTPKNTLVFPVPGHGTWTFKQERGSRNSKHIDASQSHAKLRLLIDRAMAPLPSDPKDGDARPSAD
ncbi:ParB/RepB/Spo0J family partition protein [bacterium]|nr:ParB/RepB/Spo0J family partition protein [bacterium]